MEPAEPPPEPSAPSACETGPKCDPCDAITPSPDWLDDPPPGPPDWGPHLLVFPPSAADPGPPPDFPRAVRLAAGLWVVGAMAVTVLVGQVAVTTGGFALAHGCGLAVAGWCGWAGVRVAGGQFARTWGGGFFSLLAGAGFLSLPASAAAEWVVAHRATPPPPPNPVDEIEPPPWEEKIPRWPKKPPGPTAWEKRFHVWSGADAAGVVEVAVGGTVVAVLLMTAGGLALAGDERYVGWRRATGRDRRRPVRR